MAIGSIFSAASAEAIGPDEGLVSVSNTKDPVYLHALCIHAPVGKINPHLLATAPRVNGVCVRVNYRPDSLRGKSLSNRGWNSNFPAVPFALKGGRGCRSKCESGWSVTPRRNPGKCQVLEHDARL